jgi:predicted TIM-barrel fold metal-dependent hydrolase
VEDGRDGGRDVTHVCEYVYCGATYDADADVCPVCHFPKDAKRARDLGFLASVPLDGLPPRIIDMHQIIPEYPSIADFQLLAMQQFRVERALLQSVPDQAVKSLWGNEKIGALAAQYPDRFWPSFFLDPRTPDAVETLARVAASGMRVIKLLPSAGYAADDPAFDEFWKTMETHGLVAMVHTGFITARHKEEETRAGVFLSSRWADPLYFDLPARKFPRLTVILCHMGGALWAEQAAHMVTQHENVWGDLSATGVFALRKLLALRAPMAWAKVFWGNDSPPNMYAFNLRLHVSALREAGAEHRAPELLHDNATRFAAAFLG